ncbi:putative alpha-L-arabinofuranosidase C [Venturia nashicola]|uniref:Putative alpha-L-arabinofuranosidase C n=1 Tax=Venturia nashicola TaxID=86259 RepID=A0A4Z1P649_9PEZI|nr:putative alpha-L-arabinofuranosidase C [Venturia nashicola]
MAQLSNAGAVPSSSRASPDLWERISGYLSPSSLILLGAYYFFLTLFEAPLLILTDFQTFHHKAFSKLWTVYGEEMSSDMPPGTAELVASCTGVVLDVGPGSGTQLKLFNPNAVTKIYGVEPAVDLHPELLIKAEKYGLPGKYEVVAAGAEPQSLIPALEKRNLLNATEMHSAGIFDSIVCIRVLCGVPSAEETAAGLYRLLKPGGRLIVCEHVKQPYPNGGDLIASLFQRFYMLIGWSFWLGGCCLDRDTDQMLRKVSGSDGWSQVKVSYSQTYGALPKIVGEYVKTG